MLLTKTFSFKTMLSKSNFFFENVLFRNTFFLKFMLFRKNFFFKIVLFKGARKTQNLRISWGKMNQNVIFCVQRIFQYLLFKMIFFLRNRAFLKKSFPQNHAF